MKWLVIGHDQPDFQFDQAFPNGVDWWGDNLDKMAKNCMKMTKLAFLGQNSGGNVGGGGLGEGGGGGQHKFVGSGGGIPPVSPLLGEALLTQHSFPEICRNDRPLNETIWTPKCDKLHKFHMVEKMKRKKFVN